MGKTGGKVPETLLAMVMCKSRETVLGDDIEIEP
jgi:hypothetical protein